MTKLYSAGVQGNLWLLIDNLHTDVESQIKWNGVLSHPFPIEQGVRQGAVNSAGEYKGFNNPLLYKLTSSACGAQIGTIPCGAPTCADDVAVAANSPENLQILLDIASHYSHREHYQLQPTKCAVLPSNRFSVNSWPWEIGGKTIPTVTAVTHIGVRRNSSADGSSSTVENNISKARGAIYSIMGAGFHGKTGLNPPTLIHLWKVYVLPILTYGLELFDLKEKTLVQLESFQGQILKQLLGLSKNTPYPAILMITGLAPIQAIVHIKSLNMLWRICSDVNSIEYQIIIRQLAMKSWRSPSWVTYIRHILSRYDLPDIYIMLQSQSSRSRWKMTCETAVHSYWESRLNQQILLYPSLKLMYRDTYRIGKLHTTISTVRPSIMDGRRSPTKLRLLTGTYGLQTNRPAFNQHYSTTCLLCKTVPETREHFICQCPALQNIRSTAWQDLHSTLTPHGINIFQMNTSQQLQLIINGSLLFHSHIQCSQTISDIESLTRRVCFKLHNERYQMLNGLTRQPKAVLI